MHRVMLSAKSYWPIPIARFIVTGHEWCCYTLTNADFNGINSHHLTRTVFAAGPNHAKIAFQIDEVALEWPLLILAQDYPTEILFEVKLRTCFRRSSFS